MRVVQCIDATNTSVLNEGQQYYAFPVNSRHAYISKFPNEKAHTGCYSLSRFKEVSKKIEQIEPYIYHYESFATKSSFIVYGFEVTHHMVAIYRDATLQNFIGCVSKEKCTAHKKLEAVTSWGAYTVFPSALTLANLEGFQEVTNYKEVIQEESTKISFEQLSLF